MPLRGCVAGVTGWTGSAVAEAVKAVDDSISTEIVFGGEEERLLIRHDAGSTPHRTSPARSLPYVPSPNSSA